MAPGAEGDRFVKAARAPRPSKFELTLIAWAERRAELEREIARVFPQVARVTVEFGRREAMTADFERVLAFGYVVNLYDDASAAPTTALNFPVTASDQDFEDAVRRAVSGWRNDQRSERVSGQKED